MNLRCLSCGHLNNIPPNDGNRLFRCYNCKAVLPSAAAPSPEASEAVGLIGGAALGAAIGGPVGAVIGAVIGAMIGREAKTDG